MYEKIGIIGSMRVRGEYLFHHRSYLPLLSQGSRDSFYCIYIQVTKQLPSSIQCIISPLCTPQKHKAPIPSSGKRSINRTPELVTIFPSPHVFLLAGSINQITHSLYLYLITVPTNPSIKQTNKQNRNPPHPPHPPHPPTQEGKKKEKQSHRERA